MHPAMIEAVAAEHWQDLRCRRPRAQSLCEGSSARPHTARKAAGKLLIRAGQALVDG